MTAKNTLTAAMLFVGLCWAASATSWAWGSFCQYDSSQEYPAVYEDDFTQDDVLTVQNPFVDHETWNATMLGQSGAVFVRIANPYVDSPWVDRSLPKWQGALGPQVVFPVSVTPKAR